ncbi:MAG: hypothetical protein QUV02_07690 [Maricaulis sp.]|uniref:hypothetical protein n=1 Tax=Maricaulis sp. TaxID=1486257 RepID=UPI001B07262A|nr:hypothetical protein [Maricaulis sp.]MBO6846284.1 hypothetical protein [Maricaulis sp.]MBO6875839.1 hypothetical protein [Maricaulis sp.]MDM7984318.1 hypothetical protein [Maricaulis sp.]
MTSDGVCARAELSIDRAREFITMRWREPVNTRSFFAALDQLDYDSAQEVFSHMLHWHANHHQGHSIRAANVIRRGSLEPMLRLWEQLTSKVDFLQVDVFRTEAEAIDWLTAPDYLARTR